MNIWEDKMEASGRQISVSRLIRHRTWKVTGVSAWVTGQGLWIGGQRLQVKA